MNSIKQNVGLDVVKGGRKLITLSKLLTGKNNEDEVRDVILHEIAHALDFEDRGTSDHSSKWKTIAKRIGANPTRCYDSKKVSGVNYKYFHLCPTCGYKAGRYRRTNQKIASCTKCGGNQFKSDHPMIPNVPAKKVEQIEVGKLNWQDLPETDEIIQLMNYEYPNFSKSQVFAQYESYSSKSINRPTMRRTK
ncbi:MAG: SprT-like domain-containing protein [Candidatus Paceibacterota bacterium]